MDGPPSASCAASFRVLYREAMGFRERLAYHLRKYADRIDHHGAPKAMSWQFTFERGEGIRFREDGRGCRLWYYGDADYERAHDEADNPAPRVDWKALAKAPRTPEAGAGAPEVRLRRPRQGLYQRDARRRAGLVRRAQDGDGAVVPRPVGRLPAGTAPRSADQSARGFHWED